MSQTTLNLFQSYKQLKYIFKITPTLATNNFVCCLNPRTEYRKIHTSPVHETFWEREKKSGYSKEIDVSQKKLILDGFKELRQEISLWKDEVKEKLESDPIMVFRPGSFLLIIINIYFERFYRILDTVTYWHCSMLPFELKLKK